LSYQWYFNHTFQIVGPTNSTLNLPDVGIQEAGSYSVIVSNAYGSTNSATTTLTVVTPLVTGITRNANGSVTLNLVGLPDSTTRIWAATNLSSPTFWQPIFTNNITAPDGTWQFTDPNAVDFPDRFYYFTTP
jgi:hypothetical protein